MPILSLLGIAFVLIIVYAAIEKRGADRVLGNRDYAIEFTACALLIFVVLVGCLRLEREHLTVRATVTEYGYLRVDKFEHFNYWLVWCKIGLTGLYDCDDNEADYETTLVQVTFNDLMYDISVIAVNEDGSKPYSYRFMYDPDSGQSDNQIRTLLANHPSSGDNASYDGLTLIVDGRDTLKIRGISKHHTYDIDFNPFTF